jgi:hypothetical protein
MSGSFALAIRRAASGSGFGFVHLWARIAEDETNPRELVGAAREDRCRGAAERTNFLFGVRMQVLAGAVWFSGRGVSDAHRLGRLVSGFADRSQFLLSSNDLLRLRGVLAPPEIFRLCRTVHLTAEICAVHKVSRARLMQRTGGDEKSARGRTPARSTWRPVSGLSVLRADPVISWSARFCGAARSAGEGQR